MPDIVPKILTGVMAELWDDVPDEPAADMPDARAGKWTPHTACLNPAV
jgi:hypothetical protein